tara:strand:- start:109 stop:372 length:264 start_codon:yes stop_codon:yes gene_type:complete
MEIGMQQLQYYLRNPSEPFTEWHEDIIESVGIINRASSQMRPREIDKTKLEKELFKFYGENSDGTYKDFDIKKVKKSISEQFRDEGF